MAANQWWQNKLAEISAPDPLTRQFNNTLGSLPVERLKEMVEQGNIARAMLREGPAAVGQQETVDPEAVDSIIGVGRLEDDNRRLELLGKVCAKVVQTLDPNLAVSHWTDKFLAVVKTNIKPLSYREIHRFLDNLPAWLVDVSTINEQTVERIRASAKIEPTSHCAETYLSLWLSRCKIQCLASQ